MECENLSRGKEVEPLNMINDGGGPQHWNHQHLQCFHHWTCCWNCRCCSQTVLSSEFFQEKKRFRHWTRKMHQKTRRQERSGPRLSCEESSWSEFHTSLSSTGVSKKTWSTVGFCSWEDEDDDELTELVMSMLLPSFFFC